MTDLLIGVVTLVSMPTQSRRCRPTRPSVIGTPPRVVTVHTNSRSCRGSAPLNGAIYSNPAAEITYIHSPGLRNSVSL